MDILNRVELVGTVVDSNFSHECVGEKFQLVTLAVKRNSGTKDVLPVIVSERIIPVLECGERVHVVGSFRSHNEETRLILNVFADEIEKTESLEDVNQIDLNAYICKKPNYRETPQGRLIADLLLACNRRSGKSDCIPSISWGRNAKYCSSLEVGTKVSVKGRVQSRGYQKKINETEFEDRVAYEVSVNLIESKEE